MTVCPLPQSYTTCALGIQFVGYVMICFGAADALCSVLFGRLARHTGRTVLFALGRRVWAPPGEGPLHSGRSQPV